MKTRRHISGGLTLAAAALLCLAGCKKDEEGEKVVLGVDFEQTAGTQKTYVGNSDKTIYWSTDDSVKVNGKNYLVHDGVVEVKLSDDGYAAVYPATEGNTLTYSGGTSGRYCTGGSVVIPATQNYTAVDGVQRLDGPMAARLDSRTGRLLFRNLYAVIKVTVTAGSSPFTLNSITVESTNSVNLAGTQPFTFSAATNTAVPTLEAPSNGSKSVTLTGISITIPAGGKDSFYLYTAPFSHADLTVKINENMIDVPTTARSEVSISRSQLRGTTVDVSNLEPMPMRFSVAEGKYVTFSPGNLQWSATNGGTVATTHVVAGDGTAAGTWRFAEHQWDYVGNATKGTVSEGGEKCNNALIASDYTGWIDLFGWGTSGYDDKYPYMTSTASTNYGNETNDIAGTDYDWGVYNAIYNPKTGKTDDPGTWRTLTKDECAYLLGTSGSTRGGVHKDDWWIYNMVKITDVGSAGVTGLIIYPDGVTEDITGKLSSKAGTTAVAITKADFEKLEALGCVFLPATGYRGETSLFDVGSRSDYWSSTGYDYYNAYSLHFLSGEMRPSYGINLYRGQSVRLVKDVK